MTLTHKVDQTVDLVKLFVFIDDLVNLMNKYFIQPNAVGRPANLTPSEVLTGMLYGYQHGLTELKDIHAFLTQYHQTEFPSLGSYSAFVSAVNTATSIVALSLLALMAMNRTKNKPVTLMIGDSTPLPVCRNIRISLHKVCKGIAERSKTGMGYFYGFKLHLLISKSGELLGIKITPGNTDDRVPVPALTEGLKGIFLGDAGYCSKLLERLMPQRGIYYLTRVRNNMKKVMTELQGKLLNLRSKVESVIGVLKERIRLGRLQPRLMNLTTSLPRSVLGHLAHYLYVLLAYEVFRYV